MKTLHLTLKRKWFDMILTGIKKQEYRELKKYWIKRLIDFKTMEAIHYDTITFSNGYSKNARKMIVNRYEQNVVWKAILEEYNSFNQNV